MFSGKVGLMHVVNGYVFLGLMHVVVFIRLCFHWNHADLLSFGEFVPLATISGGVYTVMFSGKVGLMHVVLYGYVFR